MLFIRSLIFNVVFYVSITTLMVFWMPTFFFLRRRDAWKVVRIWGISSLWFQNKIVGTRFDFSGMENIPTHGFILAAKHQSSWETFAILCFLNDPSYILKRELMFIPLFGWFAAKAKVVPVNRGKRSIAMEAMTKEARRQLAQGRQIVIFPEGTRKNPYAPPNYKYGITHMYNKIDCTILPVALNSGLFWPRQSFLRYGGTISMHFLPVIEPGLNIEDFRERLQNDIEKSTNKLMAMAANQEYPLPLAAKFAKDAARNN